MAPLMLADDSILTPSSLGLFEMDRILMSRQNLFSDRFVYWAQKYKNVHGDFRAFPRGAKW